MEENKLEILAKSIYELKDLKESILKLVSELSKINRTTDTIKVSWIIKEICNLGKPNLKENRTKLLTETDKDKERLVKRRARKKINLFCFEHGEFKGTNICPKCTEK